MEATFEPPISLYHLSGGLQLLVGSNQFFWFMSPHADEPLIGKFNGTEEYIVARFIADLKVIGIDRYETVEELKETVSDAFLFSVGPSCYVTEQIQNWFGISNALDKENSRLASRVAAQLQLCLHRLKKLSVSYRNALISTNPPVDCEFQAHNNKHSKNMASEYRSLLNELYSLRDAINTIYYKLCCKRQDAYRSKSLKKILTSANRSDAGNLIFQSMFEGDRLIHKMSTLRSIALHIIPFTNPIMSDVFMLIRTNTEFGHIPRVVVPLIDDLELLKQIEMGKIHSFPENEIVEFFTRDHHLDALDLCHASLERLLNIAELVADEIGIESKPLVLNQDNILNATIKYEDGSELQYIKDDETGMLVEVSGDPTQKR